MSGPSPLQTILDLDDGMLDQIIVDAAPGGLEAVQISLIDKEGKLPIEFIEIPRRLVGAFMAAIARAAQLPIKVTIAEAP